MRYTLSVRSRAMPGRQEEYDRWYDEIHVGDVLALPGFLSCQRFRELDGDGRETGDCIAQYAVETDDPAALLQSLYAATPTMRLTDALDVSSASFAFLRPHDRQAA
jgi:hypothetical protein